MGVKKVAVVCNMYPSTHSPHAGVFIQREVDALHALYPHLELHLWFVDTMNSRTRYLLGRSRVLSSIKGWQPDIIHCHYGFTPWFAPLDVAPVVCTYHGTDLTSDWKRPISLLMHSRVDHSIVVSDQLKEFLPIGAPTTVIPCGVDGLFLAEGARSRGRRSASPLSLALLFPSSPARTVKDFPLFLRVVEQLRSRGHDVQCSTLDGLAPAGVVEEMRRADILVMTSITEGSPVTIREALSCGCRVVSTDVGDVSRWLPHFSGCRVVESRSASDLADACVVVLAEKAPDTELAASLFSIDQEARAVYRLYEELANRGGRGVESG